jgi:hypothetical protein
LFEFASGGFGFPTLLFLGEDSVPPVPRFPPFQGGKRGTELISDPFLARKSGSVEEV